MAAIGLIMSFVGLGERGFKTLELKLIGPCLLGCGLSLVVFQVVYCMLPSWSKGHSQSKDIPKKIRNDDAIQKWQRKPVPEPLEQLEAFRLQDARH